MPLPRLSTVFRDCPGEELYMNRNVLCAALVSLCLSISGTAFAQDAVYEGSISVSRYGTLPGSGYYGASNAFPKNSTVRVSDAESGQSVDVLIVENLDNPNIFLMLSPEAAKAIELDPSSVSRAKVVQVPPGDPLDDSLSNESALSPDPDLNPAASVPSGSEQEMIEQFIQNELPGLAEKESELEAVPSDDTEVPEAESGLGPRKPKTETLPLSPENPKLPVVAEEPEKAEKLEPSEEPPEQEIPDHPRAVAMTERQPEASAPEWHGASAPPVPAVPERVEMPSTPDAAPSIASLPTSSYAGTDEEITVELMEPSVLRRSKPEPVLEQEQELEQEQKLELYAFPYRRAQGDRGDSWEKLDAPTLPRGEEDPLLAGLRPDGGKYRPLIGDLPKVPGQEDSEKEILLASGENRTAPLISDGELDRPAAPELIEREEEKQELYLAEGGPRNPEITSETGTPEDQPDLREPAREMGPIFVGESISNPPIQQELSTAAAEEPKERRPRTLPPEGDVEIVLEKAEERPPKVDLEELEVADKREESREEDSEKLETEQPDFPAIERYMKKELEASSYYLQLAVFREVAAAGRLAQTLSETYPVTIHPKEDGTSFRVMVGPLRKDESGALLVSFRAGGYRDAFIKRGTQ